MFGFHPAHERSPRVSRELPFNKTEGLPRCLQALLVGRRLRRLLRATRPQSSSFRHDCALVVPDWQFCREARPGNVEGLSLLEQRGRSIPANIMLRLLL